MLIRWIAVILLVAFVTVVLARPKLGGRRRKVSEGDAAAFLVDPGQDHAQSHHHHASASHSGAGAGHVGGHDGGGGH